MRYAGFWPRFWASLVDLAIFLMLVPLMLWLEASSRSMSMEMFTNLILFLFFPVYSIYFHGRYGQTLGKMVARVKVVQLNGTPISFRHALCRSSVDLFFSILAFAGQLVALFSVSNIDYMNAPTWMARSELVQAALPSWDKPAFILGQVWAWSELVVLLFNSKRRALHDFIAGTIVTHIK